MDPEDKLPRFAMGLLDLMDETVGHPDFPIDANGFAALDEAAVRRAAFTAGARAVVDEFKLAYQAEEAEDEDPLEGLHDEAASVFPPLFDTGGGVHQSISSVRVAE